MERHYLEEEPNSAPQFVDTPKTSYLPPGHNDKYFVNKDGQQWDTGPIPVSVAGDAVGQKKKTRWRWILVALGVVIIVVAAVVGGVLGSRAHKSNKSDSALSSPTPSSTTSTTTTTSPTSTTSTTSTNTPSATPSTINQSSANNGTTPLATFNMYATDTCGGTDDSFAITSVGAQRCVLVPSNKRSIRVVDNSSCIITTWSGSDCLGSSFRVPDTACHSVLYAAVSVYC